MNRHSVIVLALVLAAATTLVRLAGQPTQAR